MHFFFDAFFGEIERNSLPPAATAFAVFSAGLTCTHGWRAGGYVVTDNRSLRVQDSGDRPTDSTTKY